RADAVCGPGRLRLGAHSGADARVRRRRGHAARSGKELPGPDGISGQERPQRQRPCAADPGARPRAAPRGAREGGAAPGGVSQRVTDLDIITQALPVRRAAGLAYLVLSAWTGWLPFGGWIAMPVARPDPSV